MARRLPIGVLKNHTKHIVQNPIFTVAAGATGTSTIADAVAVEDMDNSNAVLVREGCTIKAVWVEMWMTSDDVTQSSFVSAISIIPANAANPTNAEMLALNVYQNKNNILEIHQGLTNSKTSVSQPLYGKWIQIPKGKQRFALGQKMVISFTAVADGITICGGSIFKEYY